MGGNSWFADSNSPYAEDQIKLVAFGGYLTKNPDGSGLNKWRPFEGSADYDGEHSAGRALAKTFDFDSTTEYTETVDNQTTRYYVGDFGLLREMAMRMVKKDQVLSLGDSFNDGTDRTKYPAGPYSFAAKWATQMFGDVRAKVNDYNASGPNLHPFADTPSQIDTLVGKLVNNTAIWGKDTVADLSDMMGQSSNYTTLETTVADGLVFDEIPDPECVWDDFAWASIGLSDIVADIIDAPTAVDVTDNIDDAVAAYTALAESRFAADEARLRASLFSTRAIMATNFDNALAILSANKNAQISEYDKSLRVKQAELQAQADMAHQQNMLERNTRNAQLDLEADRATAQNLIAEKGAETQWLGTRLNIEEITLRARSANNETSANVLRARTDLMRTVYDTVIAWMNARATLVTNAGPLASVINTACDMWMKGRDQEMQWKRDIVALSTQYASGMEGIANLKYNALTQNMSMYRETLAALGGIPGGSYRPSGFQNLQSVIGLGAGIASTGIQSALALMG